MDLSIANVINVSVSETPTGIGAYNTSNIALFTAEEADESFGDDGFKIYLEPSEVAKDFGSNSVTFKQANAIFSQQPSILAGGGYLVVIPYLEDEVLDAAITRTKDLVQYFGIISARIESEADGKAAAAVVQPLNKILFLASATSADIDPGGYFDDIRTSSFDKSRCLFYADAAVVLLFMAAYASRGLSTNFNGSNTTSTMHLKDLIGISPDAEMTQTLLAKAKDAGADVYVSLQGIPKVFCSGANRFFDQVYNQEWCVGALKVAGFNYLAQSSTKIPQTEPGMDGLKGAYRQVLEQGVSNGYLAPGRWDSPTQFGIQDDFLKNVSQRGYYIYSQSIAQQLQSDREARKAPLVQLALKEAGAIHSSDVIVNINV